jgi:methylglutaconyl-CoA hydratase
MSYLIQSKTKRVLHVSLNRPDSRNALDTTLVRELRSVLSAAASDVDVRSVVITGAGTVFSAGADLVELKALGSASVLDNRRSSEELARLLRDIRLHPKVIVARVNGHAIAGGCGLAVACDFAIASDEAKLGFTEVRIGFVPAIVSALLRNRVSDAALRDLLLTGRLISAEQAVELGLIWRSVPIECLDEEVDNLTTQIEENTSPTAIAWTKRMLATSASMPPGTASRFLASFNVLARSTRDVRKGVTAFLEKQKPEW